ncbi:MAG TPA: hypothetical protein DD381_13940 [Lentisphaeria bacterium]|nr:MAG: hypothetical protein A2X47_02435 [Lentisphaerae bacterium GWF2_38_69]HBM17424.1 hypothetical protein [Lentisphaeria bacterium]
MPKKNVSKRSVDLVKSYLTNLVKAKVLTNDQYLGVISKLNEEEKVLKSSSIFHEPERLISKREVATILGYKSLKSVDKIERKGLIERVDFSECGVRYRLSDTERLFKAM